VWAYIDRVEGGALRGEQLEQESLHLLETLARIAGGTEAILVADHYQPKARFSQPRERGEHVGQQSQLVEPVDLLIGRLLDERAVPIDIERGLGGRRRHVRGARQGRRGAARSARACRY